MENYTTLQLNTRFCPTTNRGLHFGHLYMMLINQSLSNISGGKFRIFQDDKPLQLHTDHLKTQKYIQVAKLQREQLEWLNIIPDSLSYIYQEEYKRLPNCYYDQRKLFFINDWDINNKFKNMFHEQYQTLEYDDISLSTIYYTIIRVLIDIKHETNLIIRGEDLAYEQPLYEHLWRLFSDTQPAKQIYLPLLLDQNNLPIHKSTMTPEYSLEFWRDNKTGSNKIIDFVKRGFLIDFNAPITLENIKKKPKVDINEFC